jgi:uncharacterized membrane protein YhaH (DUF805 family)
MADVFISYAREDRPRAEQVARALSAAGIESFWDSEIPPGQTWADYIEGKLAQCKTLIVLWSANSTGSQWVREEARMGRDSGKLIPVMLDASPAPFGFGEVQGADLSTWRGEPNHPQWQRVLRAVEAALGGPRAAPPPMAPPAFQAQGQTDKLAAMLQTPAGQEETPLGYIRKCLRHYFNGNGRARRAEFWWFALFQFVVLFVAAFIDVALFGTNFYGSPNLPLFSGLCGLALIGPGVSVAARRFHDVGLNGWLVAIGYVLAFAYIGGLFILVVALIPGQPRENKYGLSPKPV